MFTGITLTALVSFLAGDLGMLILGRMLPSKAAAGLKAARALARVMRHVHANAEHLPPGVVRQIQEDAREAGNEAHASIYGRNIPTGYGL